MADVPGLAFLLGGLVLASWADGKRSRRREVALGFWIGAGAYVRTATVLLVPAIVLSGL